MTEGKCYRGEFLGVVSLFFQIRGGEWFSMDQNYYIVPNSFDALQHHYNIFEMPPTKWEQRTIKQYLAKIKDTPYEVLVAEREAELAAMREGSEETDDIY